MDDCPLCFSTRFPSSLESPRMVILDTPLVIATQGCVRFDSWMDETVTPTFGNLSAIVDGSPQSLTGVSWGLENELICDFNPPAPATSLAILLDTTDTNLRNTDGVAAVAPQSVFNVV